MGIEFSDFNWFDMTVVLVVLMSTLIAFFRGFIKGLFSLITWVGSISSAYFLLPALSKLLANSINDEKVLYATAFFSVFIIVFIILSLINSKIMYSLRRYRKGAVDRTLGFAFGFARGVIIVCAVFFSMNITSVMLNYGENKERPGPKFFAEAKTYNILSMTTKSILSVLPKDFPEMTVKRIDSLKNKVTSLIQPKSVGLPRALNDEEKKMMSKVIKALPKKDYEEIRDKYQGKVGTLSDLDKMLIFRDLLGSYQKSLSEGKIKKEVIVPESDIKMLDEVLNGSKINENDIPKDEGIGYKELNIKQLDRLVDSVKKDN